MTKPLQGNHHSACADLMAMAQRELAAFCSAVRELFGREQAELAAEEWLGELNATRSLPSSTRHWRRMTLKASTRLAARVDASSILTASLALV
jgi:hypothetical protein